MMNNVVLLVFVAVIGISFSGCSHMPRVLVLHDPLTAEEHATLGLAYEVEGRPELAVREYNEALKKEQGYTPALIGLGNLAFDKGKLEEAEAYYRQALITAPEDPGVNNNLAMVYLTQQEKLGEAEHLANLALAQGGRLRPYVLDTLAHIYMQQGRYENVKVALDDAEELAPPDDHVLHQRLSRLRAQLRSIHSQAGEEKRKGQIN